MAGCVSCCHHVAVVFRIHPPPSPLLPPPPPLLQVCCRTDLGQVFTLTMINSACHHTRFITCTRTHVSRALAHTCHVHSHTRVCACNVQHTRDCNTSLHNAPALLPLTSSLSPPPSHLLPLTSSLSPPPSHLLPLTSSLSLAPQRLHLCGNAPSLGSWNVNDRHALHFVQPMANGWGFCHSSLFAF